VPMVDTGIETKEDLKLEIRDYLEKKGYQTTIDARLNGKSGVEHAFDMLAQRDDGFINYNIVISIATEDNGKAEAPNIFSFANKAYDTEIQDRVLIATNEISDKVRLLAGKQRIKVIDADQLQVLLHSKPKQIFRPEKKTNFETLPQLMEYLKKLGYQIINMDKVKGRSGTDFNFDIIARLDDEFITHMVVMDIINSEKEISLEQVSLFDIKAYDVGINNKAIIISSGLSPEAKLFAQHQRIKVFELGKKPVYDSIVTEQTPAQTQEIPNGDVLEKTEPSAEKTKPKALRQIIQAEALQLIPEVMARRYNAIPISISRNTLQVAMADPTDIFALEALSTKSRLRIKPIGHDSKEVREAIDFNYKGYGDIEKQVSLISIPSEASDDRLAVDAAVDAPLAKVLNLVVEEAVKVNASDIHLEPEEARLRVRYRIDGILHDMMSLPLNVHRALISRVKILSDMNIADHLRPQDGQFNIEAKGREIDVRVATVPTVSGEMAVLRLLDKSMASRGLSELGFLPESMAKYESMLRVPYGMMLVSGPTGSGKTTTLYASINSLNTLEQNVITIEDPAEYRFKDINQIQVNTQAGITFASGLRSILRLDPDVIMVGEIRDAETANIATQAALTGHLMLSSVHANDATSVLFRLIDLGVEPFLVAASVICVIAQRMVRRICPDCSRLIEAPMLEQMAYEKAMGEKRTQFLYGTGCESCSYTGYRGRTGIFEILPISDTIKTMIVGGLGNADIRTEGIKEGMVTMMKDGMLKVKMGITTPAEVLRSAYSPE
jgi:general secretion pathway protein E